MMKKIHNWKRVTNNSVGIYLFCCFLLCSLFGATTANAVDYSFSWTANSEPVDGYKLYYKKGGEAVVPFEDGVDGGGGTSPIELGKVTSYTISGLDNSATYHFAVTAYSGTEESDYSQVVTVVGTVGDGTNVPVAENSSVTVNEDDSYSGQLSASDLDNDPLTYSLVGQATKGTASISSSGSFSYSPNSSESGSDSFSFKVSDGSSESNTATVAVTITSVDLSATNYSFTWSANPEPVDGYNLYYKKGGEPVAPFEDGVDGGGGVSPIDLGKVTSYTIVGLDSSATYHFAVTAYTGTEESDYSQIVTVSGAVTGGTNVPVAENSSVTVSEDDSYSGQLIASDLDNDSLSYLLVSQAGKGTAVVDSSGSFSYSPNSNESGSDSFTFKVSDGSSDSNTATISITISAVNDVPVATGSTITVSEDGSTSGQLSASDLDNDPLTYSLVGQGTKGTATVSSSGGFSYSPASNESGSDSFSFKVSDGSSDSNTATVSITISAVNDVPVAAGSSITVSEDGSFNGQLSASDLDNDSLSYSLVSQAIKGTASVDSSGSFSYSPNGSESGSDSFSFKVSDGSSESNTATVAVTITPVDPSAIKYSFTWSANPEPVDGYKIHYKKGGDPVAPFGGIDANEGNSPIDVGKQTSFSLSGLAGNTTYHFAATAYTGTEESDFSQVVTVLTDTITQEPLNVLFVVTPAQGEAPFTASFDASGSTGPIANYTWAFGDGDIGSGSVVEHIFQYSGVYTVSLVVADSSGNSHQYSVEVSVSEPVDVEPVIGPTAVISTSTAVGTAPFRVKFNGRGSSGDQDTLSYSWEFGDGGGKDGKVVRYRYRVPGTYQATLTVTDKTALTDQVSTPVLILSSAPSANDPPAASMVNQPPVAAISMAPLSGTVPLTVVLDASASTDSDGSISSYTWNFGDGSSGSGKTVQNIYTETAEFTITLTVVDNEGASSTATKNLSTIPAELYFEVMELELTHEWQRVVFDQQFTDPIVAGGPPSFNETDPTTIRVRNVDSSGLDIRLQEWDYQDGTHLGELVNLLVMERGDYILADGAQIEADSFVSTTDFGSVDLRQQYEEAPVILTQVVTENEEEAVVGRLKSIGSSSFEFKLQEREQEAESHAGETVGYIAWQRGNGSILGLSYDADVVENSVNAEWSEVAFLEQFGEAPLVMAKIQTYVSGDTAALRKQNSSKTSVELKVEEETGGDEEVEHSGEAVGYIAIGVK